MFFHGSIILFFYNQPLVVFAYTSACQIIVFTLLTVVIDGSRHTLCATSTHELERGNTVVVDTYLRYRFLKDILEILVYIEYYRIWC